jgi:hypothetical protein
MLNFFKKKVPTSEMAKIIYRQCVKPHSAAFISAFTDFGAGEGAVVTELLYLKAFANVHGLQHAIKDRILGQELMTHFNAEFCEGRGTASLFKHYISRYQDYMKAFGSKEYKDPVDAVTSQFLSHLASYQEGAGSNLMDPKSEAGLKIQASMFFVDAYGAFSKKAMKKIIIV